MAGMPNGNGDRHSRGRLRFDDWLSAQTRTAALPVETTGHSGRLFVLAAGAAILILWGLLYLGFRDWRSHYRVRANFGAVQVAPTVDALADLDPPGVDPAAWKEAVGATHSMLLTVTGSNLLDMPRMESLREELKQVVARSQAHPDQAVKELAWVWDTISDRAEFVLKEGTSGRHKGHPRPEILPPRAAPSRKLGSAEPRSFQRGSSWPSLTVASRLIAPGLRS